MIIEDGSALSGVLVGCGAHIGEKCELKDGTVVGQRYHVNPGTEAKNEHLSDESAD